MTAPSLAWLAALAEEVLDGQGGTAEAVDLERLQRVIAVAEAGPEHPIDQAGRLLWAIAAQRPLPARNPRLAVLAADLHLGDHGMALVTEPADQVRKLLDGIATATVDLAEAVAWVRDHVELRPKETRMFERFTDRARQVLVLAQEQARLLNHGFIGTEHILLGLLAEGTGVAARVLTDLGMTVDGARAEVTEIIGPAPGHAEGGVPPFTPRAKRVLELSLREALSLSHNYIGTEHMLLGLVREGEGVGAQIIRNALGREDALEFLRQRVTEELDAHLAAGKTATDRPASLSPSEESRLGQTLVAGRGAEAGSAPKQASEGARMVLINAYQDRVLEIVARRLDPDTNSEALRRGNAALDAAVDSWDPSATPSLADHAIPLIEEAVAEARAKSAPTKRWKCSFCGKSQTQVKKLIAGPDAYICDECIDLCNDIIKEELAEEEGTAAPAQPHCAVCREELQGHTAVHVIEASDHEVRVLVCDRCGAVIGTIH